MNGVPLAIRDQIADDVVVDVIEQFVRLTDRGPGQRRADGCTDTSPARTARPLFICIRPVAVDSIYSAVNTFFTDADRCTVAGRFQPGRRCSQVIAAGSLKEIRPRADGNGVYEGKLQGKGSDSVT